MVSFKNKFLVHDFPKLNNKLSCLLIFIVSNLKNFDNSFEKKITSREICFVIVGNTIPTNTHFICVLTISNFRADSNSIKQLKVRSKNLEIPEEECFNQIMDCCCSSREKREAKRRNDIIDRYLKKEKRLARWTLKILLLGE